MSIIEKINGLLISNSIKIEKKGMVAVISFDHPPVNAISIDMLADLRAIFDNIIEDKDVRCIVITSIGKHFSAGGDMTTFRQLPRGCNTAFGNAVYSVIENCPVPVIAAIHGACLGGGMELTLACDIRIASENTKFGLVEATLGIAPNYGGATRLPWLIGEGNAKLLLFTGEKFGAEQAKEYGLVQAVYPDDCLMEKTMELANKIAANAPKSAEANKRVIHTSRKSIISAGLDEEDWAAVYLSRSNDSTEGFNAFAEKRKPNFKNE